MGLVLILAVLIAFIVVATTKFKLHPFLALLAVALLAGLAYQLPPLEIGGHIARGFGGILGGIGIVIAFGTIIGVILERSGAAITTPLRWLLPCSDNWGWTVRWDGY